MADGIVEKVDDDLPEAVAIRVDGDLVDFLLEGHSFLGSEGFDEFEGFFGHLGNGAIGEFEVDLAVFDFGKLE